MGGFFSKLLPCSTNSSLLFFVGRGFLSGFSMLLLVSVLVLYRAVSEISRTTIQIYHLLL